MTFSFHPSTPIDRDVDVAIVLDWLTLQFHELADEGHDLVNGYWKALREIENNRSFYQRATLGLRMRIRENLSLSLEWYVMGTIGKAKRPVAKSSIPKARGQESYSIKSLMRRQPAFLLDLVEESESHLALLRKRQHRLLKIRDALGEYMRLMGHEGMTGSRLMEQFLKVPLMIDPDRQNAKDQSHADPLH